MDELVKFQHSTGKLMEFLNKWAKPLGKKCEDKNASNQQKASYYLWARYSMSIKTIRHICAIEFFPDLCVIGRCCLEISASLQAVLSDEKAANDYLEFEKHSKSNYLKYLKSIGETQKATRFEENLSELGVENPENYKWNKWCAQSGGYSKLIQNHKGPEEREFYLFSSDFAHGSIIAIQILQNLKPSSKLLESLIQMVYSDYILSTKSFLDKVWGQIITNDSKKCKNEFYEIARLNC